MIGILIVPQPISSIKHATYSGDCNSAIYSCLDNLDSVGLMLRDGLNYLKSAMSLYTNSLDDSPDARAYRKAWDRGMIAEFFTEYVELAPEFKDPIRQTRTHALLCLCFSPTREKIPGQSRRRSATGQCRL